MITKLIALLLLLPVSVYGASYFNGVKINQINNLCGNVGGCYFYGGVFKGQINLNEEYTDPILSQIIHHEFGHHIWYKMTIEEQKTWFKSGQCYVSEYAKINYAEDFAEVMKYYLSDLENDCWLKILVAEYYYKKYQ